MSARVEVRTMNPGTPRAFDRAYLYCPRGHETGSSSPVGRPTAQRWLSGDYSNEWCPRRDCGWKGERLCSTCGQPPDAPPCSVNRAIGWSGHTVEVGERAER